MRYVNLKKRNTSKFQYVSKRLATVSLLCLALTAVIVVPLTNKVQRVQAKNQNQVIDITDENLGNDFMKANQVDTLNEVDL